MNPKHHVGAHWWVALLAGMVVLGNCEDDGGAARDAGDAAVDAPGDVAVDAAGDVAVNAAVDVAGDAAVDAAGRPCPPPDSAIEAGCIFGSQPGQTCGDTSTSAACVDGAYVCPAGTFPARLCTCFGPNCPLDGGADAAGGD